MNANIDIPSSANIKRSRKYLLGTTVFCSLAFVIASPSFASPENGIVSGGQATISILEKQTTINQSTDKAIIDWRRFDVNVDESVHFQQPSSNSITLNRIGSGQESRIDGQVSANGNIIIVNPDGIIFGNNSRIDANGLVATTSDVDNDAFMSGSATVTFNKQGNANAKIENKGHITVKEAGLVGLVAPHVENSGVIEARMGKVILAGAEHVTVDFAGDGLISFATDIETDSSHIVKNSGQIKADGGDIILTALDARGIVDQIVDNSGSLEALSVNSRQGNIVLSAPKTSNSDHKSRVSNSGKINASGKSTGQKGGKVEVLADIAVLQSGTDIDVSGANGGGIVKIGGDWQGQGDTQRADLTVVEENTKIDASAIGSGDGGTVVIWSDDTTWFYGNIDAKGGMESGDGGNVEVSGKKLLDFQGLVNTKATNGNNGSLLLDPTNIRIADVASNQNVATVGFLTYEPSGDNVTSVLDIDTVLNNLDSNGNVVIQTHASGSQEGDIIWDAAANYYCDSCAGSTITLDAHDDIILNQSAGGDWSFVLIAGDDVEINAPWYSYLNILPKNTASDVFLGGTGTGTEISSASLANMNSSLNIGYGGSLYTGDVYISGDRDWSGSLSVNTAGDVIIADNQDFQGNSLDIRAHDLSLIGQITGNYLSLNPIASSAMGFGDGMGGDFNLTSAEWARVGDDWNYIGLGTGGLVSGIEMEGKTAGNWYINTSGNLGITGDLIADFGDVNISAADLDFTGDLMGVTTLYLASSGTGMGLGDGMAGSFDLTDAELDRMTGFSNYNITSLVGNMNLAEKTWDGDFSGYANTLNFYGEQRFEQGKDLIINSDAVNFYADIIGDGEIYYNSSLDLGLGDGASGGIVLDNDTLNHIKGGWSVLNFYTSGNVNMNAQSWLSDLKVSATNLVVSGNQTFGNNNATFTTNTIDLSGQLQGTGTLSLNPNNNSVGLAGQAGTFNLTTAELNNIVDGWSEIIIGNTQFGTSSTMLVGAHTWLDPLKLRIGGSNSTLRVQGAQTMGSNNLTIQSNGLIDLNAPVTGSGILTLQQRTSNAMTVGTGGTTGTTRITSADINSFVVGQGWGGVVLGLETSTGTFLLNQSINWGSDLTLQARATTFTISGAQNVGNNDLTIRSHSGLSILGNLTGTGTLKVDSITNDRSIVVGSATGGNIAVDDTEISRFSDGWNKIVFGKDAGAQVIVNSAVFNDAVELHSGTNVQLNGLSMGTNDLSVFSNNIDLNSAITGTGNLLFQRTTSGTYDIGDTAYLDAAEISNIQDGWSKVTFGDVAGADSFIFSDAVSFADSTEFLTNTGSIILNDTVSSTAGVGNALTFVAANGTFNNNAGQSAIDTGAGRYLIYLDTIKDSNLRGLDIPTRRFGTTYTNTSPDNIPNTGNTVLFGALRSDAIEIPESAIKAQVNLQPSFMPSGYYFNNPTKQTFEVQDTFGLENMSVYNDYRPIFSYTVSDDVITVNEDEKNQEKL